MQCSVFECSICFNYYDNVEHKPLSLPCGHVYCIECLQKMFSKGDAFCPADKTHHNVKVSDLPCCYAILNNLPKRSKVQGVCFCKQHPNKKIKFMCEIHKTFLCSSCVLGHTGSGHQIANFKANCKCNGAIRL